MNFGREKKINHKLLWEKSGQFEGKFSLAHLQSRTPLRLTGIASLILSWDWIWSHSLRLLYVDASSRGLHNFSRTTFPPGPASRRVRCQ